MKVIKKEFKSALNKYKFPDSWFWARYSTNPYSGCQHACIYCDARSERYYLNDFENEVVVKIDNDKKIDNKIKRARKMLPDVVGPGGVSDAYQPIEREVENTKKTLLILKKHKFPVNVATKSKLILRDISILSDIANDTWCTVGFSITTIDEEVARFLEPHSSTPLERLNAMKKIKEIAPKIQIGTYFMPIIPFLEDGDDNLEEIVSKSKEVGADFVLFSPGLTLRDSQKSFFLKKLKNSKYKGILDSLLDLYGEKPHPTRVYARSINKKMLQICKKYKIQIRIKRWIPEDYRKWNYKTSQLLLDKYYIDSLLGPPDKSFLWAGLYLNNMDESIVAVRERGQLSRLKGFNPRITDIVERFLKNKNAQRTSNLDYFLKK
ncbi:MAG: radical SAM protein [Promethearchaeota archaeon]